MPQNWWEMFPEIQPSPAARPRSLPGPGNFMSGPAMDPRPASLYDPYGPDQAPPSAFDPAYFSGGELGADNIPGRQSDRVTPPFHGQPPLAGGDVEPAIDRDAAIRHAAVAIQRGADPQAVRSRLNQMGLDDAPLDRPSPFSDLVPGGRQAQAWHGAGHLSAPQDMFAATEDRHGALSDVQSRPKADLYSALLSKGRLESHQDRRIAGQLARERGGDARVADDIYRGMRGLAPRSPTAGGPPNATAARSPTAAMSHGLRGAGAQANPRVPPPAPWRPGGAMEPAQVEQYADLGMRMYQLHRARGMTPQQAAAWAANAAAESHGDYRRPQDGGGPAYGLFMWERERQRAFQAQFGHPIQQSTEEEQLAFRDWELSNTLAGTARRIPQASSAGDIAAAITRHYEGPADWRHAMWDRSNIAEAILRRAMQMPDIANSNPAPGGARQQRQGISGRRTGPIRD
jgi:hypothetical protein